MAAPDDRDPPFDDPVIRAGEFALGLLEGADQAAAQRELLAAGSFADAVDWWRNRLACLAEEAGEVRPSSAVWQAIEQRINGTSGAVAGTVATAPRAFALSGWRLATAIGAAAAIAAALVLFVSPPGGIDRQVAPSQVAQPQLIAQLRGDDGDQYLATRIDPADHSLSLKIVGLTPDDAANRSPELWVVPEGAAPVSLGLIPGEGSFKRQLDDAERELLTPGATLAVTIEDRNTAPHPAPTTPILLAGSLTKL